MKLKDMSKRQQAELKIYRPKLLLPYDVAHSDLVIRFTSIN